MSKPYIQAVKRGTETWELTRVSTAADSLFEYELIGRVIRDGERYYAELPRWQDIGFAWDRPAQRGWLIPKPAYLWLKEHAEKKMERLS